MKSLPLTQKFIIIVMSVIILTASVIGYSLYIEQQVTAYWTEGNKLAASGEYKAAIEQYSQALELNENNSAIHFSRAEAYIELKAYEEALIDFELILQKGPTWLVAIRKAIYADSALFDQLSKQQENYPDLVTHLSESVVSMMGLNIDPKNPKGNPAPTELQDMGVAWVRFSFKDNAGTIEPYADSLSFYDDKVQKFNEANINILMVLSFETYPDKPDYDANDIVWDTYITKFSQRCQQIAKHYGDRVQAYQIWNEPDFSTPLPNYDPRVPPEIFGRLMNETYSAIKYVSSAKVVMGGLNSGDVNWLANVVQMQESDFPADIVALHAYGQRPAPNWSSADWGFGDVNDFIIHYQQVISKPLWITETGMDTTDDLIQGEYLSRLYQTIISQFPDTVERVFWFSYSDGMVPPFGLIDQIGRRKSAYNAYRQVALVPLDNRSTYAVEYLSHNTPITMTAGQTQTVTITIRNTSYRTWVADDIHPIHLGYKWYSSNGLEVSQRLWNDNRASLPHNLPPGESISFNARLNAPRLSGNYEVRWDMVEEMQTWFAWQKSPTLDVKITVLSKP